MSILKVENITKIYKDKIALDNISFEIEEGEIFGLIGPNGAGKSTLINIISDLCIPDSGKVLIDNQNLRDDPVNSKKLLGLVPQELAVFEHLTPIDNLEYFGTFYGLNKKDLKDRIDESLEVTGLNKVRKKKVKKLSGGMKRRLNIAIALLNHPKILILDEPTVGVDTQSRNDIFKFVKRMSRENKMTVIYTSHYIEEVESLCSNVFILDEGKEVAYGDLDHLKSLVSAHTILNLEIKNISKDLVESILDLKGIVSLKENNGYSLSFIIDEDFNLSNALKSIDEYDANVTKIFYDEPSLEDVFLTITGKKFKIDGKE